MDAIISLKPTRPALCLVLKTLFCILAFAVFGDNRLMKSIIDHLNPRCRRSIIATSLVPSLPWHGHRDVQRRFKFYPPCHQRAHTLRVSWELNPDLPIQSRLLPQDLRHRGSSPRFSAPIPTFYIGSLYNPQTADIKSGYRGRESRTRNTVDDECV